MRRVGALACLAAMLAIAATAAAEPPIPTPQPAPLPAPTAAPPPAPQPVPTPEPILTVRMLQAPDELDAAHLRELARELERANAAGVLVLLPGGATVADGEDAARAQAELAATVAQASRPLTVVPQDGKADGDASRVLAAGGARVEPVTSTCAPECVLETLGLDGSELALLEELDGSPASSHEVLSSPAGGDDGGGAPVELLLVGVALVGMTAVAAGVLGRRRPARGGRMDTESAVGIGGSATQGGDRPRRPPPEPRGKRDGRASPVPPHPAPIPPPRRNGREQPALVTSVLEPEGYVELDGCLHRVRWATDGVPAPAPGEWVEVEGRQGRLWAFPHQSRTRPVVGA